jgi:polysaccharide biosynthesis protein PslH
MKKRILYVTTLLPFPPDMGGKMKTLSTLRQLVKKYDVHLFCFVDKKEDLVYKQDLRKIGVKDIVVIVSPVIAEKHKKTQLMILFKSLFTLKPYSVYKYSNKKMYEKIDDFLSRNRVDVLWIDHTIQTQYFSRHFNGLKVLETHNYKSDFFWKMFLHEDKMLWKAFSFHEWLKFKLYEPRELKKADLVFAISDKEKEKIKSVNRNVATLLPRITVTGNTGKFESKKLYFVGLLTWYPNKQGAQWFVEEIFPGLKKVIPELTLDIVGDFSKKWKPQGDQGVVFHGYEKNLRKYWRQASIFIVPLKYGSGIRIKILEAFANGLPVVTTSAGADGLPDIIKNKLIIKDDEKGFVQAIKRLLSDKKYYFEVVNKSKEAGNLLKNNQNLINTLKVNENKK